ncbi:MAG TPA: DapH/DapD/GlmU-related protein [Candidatus Saccharicenans sp.]|nr:DapH/DapD/GlmU-related protein [Candidatus Saccharicenans sp.]
MTKKLQVLISQLRAESGEGEKLPELLSARARLNHLIKVCLELRPDRVVIISSELPPQPARKTKNKTDRLLFIQREQTVGENQLTDCLASLKKEGDLLLLSTEFFPVSSDIFLKALKTHRENGYRLTLLAGKQKTEAGRAGEDYFVYPGLAVVNLDEENRHLVLEKSFKPSGELDVVRLTDYLKPDYDGLGFDWIGDEEKGSFLVIVGPADWSRAASILTRLKVAELEKQGVIFLSPEETWIDPEVQIGRGSIVYPWVIIEGRTRIGSQCHLYPHSHIIDSQLSDGVKVFSSTVIEGSRLEKAVQVGPFSRLRPETRLKAGSRVGNFVEMKKTVFGPESKAMHLSYLGDAQVGDRVNIGAGTITCNYDGEKKNKTTIGRETFVGSGTELVAPVKIGRGAYIAAGSTITDNVSPEALAIARARQVEKKGWARKRRELIELRKKEKDQSGK